MGEGISEANDQESYNNVNSPTIENDTEEQSTEDNPETQEETILNPTMNYTTVSGRASRPQNT